MEKRPEFGKYRSLVSGIIIDTIKATKASRQIIKPNSGEGITTSVEEVSKIEYEYKIWNR